eukprot:gene8692-25514_t
MAVVAEGNDYIKVGLCRGHAREGLAVPMLKTIARAKCARNWRIDFNFVGDEVSFFTQEKVKGFMSCPLSTPQYCTALIVPSSGKKEEED